MMKRKLWIGVLTTAIAVGSVYGVASATGIGAGNGNSESTPVTTTAASTSPSYIGFAAAQQRALAEFDGRVESIELEQRRNSAYYEVDIEKGNIETEVKIDARTGQTLGIKEDRDDDNDDHKYDHNRLIGAAAAAAAAQKHTGGSVQEVSLDHDDGRAIYEVELRTSRGETEVEIDAYTAKVLQVDHDDDDRYDD
ncbi:PepSY domain-containing protein [Paenibacillus daejeonensis]|uniref:PepSY domain-containing protein n=1 Tax=Paenibacillus daejeonensis TaxID=135193 RepID=UPI0003646C1C|nr:PepSY domain-containing protein [Paenibacillus daejeonensis]